MKIFISFFDDIKIINKIKTRPLKILYHVIIDSFKKFEIKILDAKKNNKKIKKLLIYD